MKEAGRVSGIQDQVEEAVLQRFLEQKPELQARVNRITSYNVCYTKLLRDPDDGNTLSSE